MKKMTRSQKTILFLMFLTVLCLCAFLMALIPPESPQSSPPTPTFPQVPTSTIAPVGPAPLQHRAAGAIVQCRQFIKDRLISPSSAKFSREEAYKVNGEPMNYHAVTGIVESQNRMGVWLQSGYRCDVHYMPDDYTFWVLDYLDIEE